MRYRNITPLVRKFLGAFEGFRKVGFRAEDLYFVLQPSATLGGRLGGFCSLKLEGKEFSVELGPVPKTYGKTDEERKEILGREFKKVCEAVNQGLVPQEDLDRIWRESEIHERPGEFLLALIAKGFTVSGDKEHLS